MSGPGSDRVGDYFAALGRSDGDIVAGGVRWREYDEQPHDVVEADGVVVVRSHFQGTSADGVRVGFDPVTVLNADDAGVRGRAGWHDRELPVLALVTAYFAAANGEDWAAFAELWTEDARLEAVGGPPREGRDSVVRAYRRFHDLFGRHEDQVQQVLITGPYATVTGRFVGTNPQGVAIEFDWLDLFELSEDRRRIRRLSHWHDRDLVRSLMARTD